VVKNTLRFKLRIDFITIGSLIVLALGLFSSFLWFIIPAMVAVLLRQRGAFSKSMVAGFFIAHLIFAYKVGPVGSLEILSVGLLFTMGILLRLINYKKGTFGFLVYTPVVLTILAALALYFGEWLSGYSAGFAEWCRLQVASSSFPAISDAKNLPESFTGFYEKVMVPILEKGFLGWLSFVFGLVFFINAAFENMLKASKKISVAWKGFPFWKSSDFVLVTLVIGLGFLSLTQLKGVFSAIWVSQIGWTFLIASLFPILIQGSAIASYLIPRLGGFFVLILMILVILEPLPVLLLAGFFDLWFDLRSKIKFEPKSD